MTGTAMNNIVLKDLQPRRQRVSAEGYVSAKTAIHQQPETASRFKPSVIDRLYQQGSARIRFPDTGPGPLQAVLLNTAGGLTGDDHIQWGAFARERSHLCISTAACEKIYRSHGPDAMQTTRLDIADHARLEWMPQESILFNGACLKRSMEVQLEEHAEAVIVESIVFGRQAMNESIDKLKIRDRWRVHRCGKLLHAEELHLNIKHSSDARTQCMLHHYSAMSTLLLVSNEHEERLQAMAAQVRTIHDSTRQSVRFGASVLPFRLLVRVLATDSYELRKFLIPCLEIVNAGRAVPTVWNV